VGHVSGYRTARADRPVGSDLTCGPAADVPVCGLGGRAAATPRPPASRPRTPVWRTETPLWLTARG